MTVILPFLIAFLIGFLILKFLIKSVNSFAVFLLRIFIGIGIGMGILSISTFLSLLIPGVNKLEYHSKLVNKFALILIAILILVIFYLIKDPFDLKDKSPIKKSSF